MKAAWQLDGQITRRAKMKIKYKIVNTFYNFTYLIKSRFSKRNTNVGVNHLLLIDLNKSYQSRSIARRAISPSFRIFKENISYTYFNTPPPPLNNVPKRGFSL